MMYAMNGMAGMEGFGIAAGVVMMAFMLALLVLVVVAIVWLVRHL